MPLGVVSDADFEKELGNSSVELIRDSLPSPLSVPVQNPIIEDKGENIDTVTGEVVDLAPKGRGKGSTEVPNSLRNVIAQEVIENGRESALSLARSLGISDSSVSAYTASATSTATIDKKDPKLADFVSRTKHRISKRASLKALKAIEQITDEKLEEAPAGVLAAIAKSLSGVVKDMEPEKTQLPQGVQFIVFAPQIRNESSFETVQVNE